ncbi:hypothetical protein O9992_20155 [Vibrio lentus]|nr:hypothetical protein [Vibrio lentus]
MKTRLSQRRFRAIYKAVYSNEGQMVERPVLYLPIRLSSFEAGKSQAQKRLLLKQYQTLKKPNFDFNRGKNLLPKNPVFLNQI